MTRIKRTSQVLEKAEQRATGLRSIDPALDLGHGLSLQAYSKAMATLRAQVGAYNEFISALDRAGQTVRDSEQQLRALSERMLIAVAARYGKDSYEYAMAGGTRRRDRRRPSRQD
jgi:hypothetical protein